MKKATGHSTSGTPSISPITEPVPEGDSFGALDRDLVSVSDENEWDCGE
jgi:hypothetical protein